MEKEEIRRIEAELDERLGYHDTDNGLPTCPCGWDGKGTGQKGRIIAGDRCPECGQYLR